MDCPFTVSSAEWSPPLVDRITFPHPDGTQTVYLLATPEREAAGELADALAALYGSLYQVFSRPDKAAMYRALTLADNALTKAQRRPS